MEMQERQTIEDGVKVPPPLSDWKEVLPQDKGFALTFGKARRALWEQFKLEHKLFINNVRKLKGPPAKSALEKVYQVLLGPSSKLAKLIISRLDSESSFATVRA